MRKINFKQIEIITVLNIDPSKCYAVGYAITEEDETVELVFKSVIETSVKHPIDAVAPRWHKPNDWYTHRRTEGLQSSDAS